MATRNNIVKNEKTVVVIGNGMVGYKFCEKLIAYDSEKTVKIKVFGKEPIPAYDRVQLSSYFSGNSAEDLLMAPKDWYADNGIELYIGERVISIGRITQMIVTDQDRAVKYDKLVIATGSKAFVPPIPGIDKDGVFVYRTIADLEKIKQFGDSAGSAAVIGGGLLGLEAAKACVDMGLRTHVVEFAPRLMPRQLDQTGSNLLKKKIEDLGVEVLLNRNTKQIAGNGKVEGMEFADDTRLDIDMIVVSAGIKPYDDLAKTCDLETGPRGGFVVDDYLRTTRDDQIYVIGEAALCHKMIYGLVSPGYEMADVVAANICGDNKTFTGADMSTKLKLLGVDVASLGDPFLDEDKARPISIYDANKGIYKKIVVSPDGKKLLGAILVGNADEYGQLLTLMKSGRELPPGPESLIIKSDGSPKGMGVESLEDSDQICSCNNVNKGEICTAIREQEFTSVPQVQKFTAAGTGCGGCLPLVNDILKHEMKKAGVEIDNDLCEHFAMTRQDLFMIVRTKEYKRFDKVLESVGTGGNGCEICKPAVASIIASLWNEQVYDQKTIQDTNDRFLANIQRNGTHSVIPRVPGGEIKPDQLIALGQVAKKYNLYCKITGGQRVDLFGAQVNDLPDIWEELINAGFETGHAYAKALRTVKSCVGSTWCRYGVADSVGLAIRIENRYKGLRSPHKIKSAVSGCVRECAEAQSKDFGIISTENGWNLYVCGNGGATPRHADLLAEDLDEPTLVKYIDRFLMFYVRTADRLQRTSVWLENLEGGIEYLKSIIVDDKLGLGEELERDMQHIVDTYQCEWKAVVEDPVKRASFKHFGNLDDRDDNIVLIEERTQTRPADWKKKHGEPKTAQTMDRKYSSWVRLGSVNEVPENGGATFKHGRHQIVVFNFTSRNEWYATQNLCPHKREMVLYKGIIGDTKGLPKIACPMHKKTFCLKNGEGISDPSYSILTFPVKIKENEIFVELPPKDVLDKAYIHGKAEPAPAGV